MMSKFWDRIREVYIGKSGEFPCIAKVIDVRKSSMESLVNRYVIVIDGKSEDGTYPIKLPDDFPSPPDGCDNWRIDEKGLEFIPKWIGS